MTPAEFLARTRERLGGEVHSENPERGFGFTTTSPPSPGSWPTTAAAS